MLLERSSTAALIAALFLVVSLIACGGGSSLSPSPTTPITSAAPGTPTPGTSPQPAPTQANVVMLVEENHSYEQVVGNTNMPYLNGLIQQGALAQQYYASAHPSLPNYFDLTTGATQTLDNNWPGPLSADNLARELNASGK